MYLCPVRLSADEIADYYEGFSNATLWPLYHDVIVKPIYHREWWDAYVTVNRRFADATAKVAAEGATVWIQDYQLQLVPKMLRMLRPDLTIGFFLHIPFPPVELFMQMPWRTEITEGLLGADLVGFHLPGGAQNFLILARRLVGANTSRGDGWCAVPVRRSRRRLPHRQGRRLPDLHRLDGTRPTGPQSHRPAAGPRDPQRARQSAQDPARRRPTRLHQGHRRSAAGVFGAAGRASGQTGRHRSRSAGDAKPGARRELHRDARRHRAPSRAHQRRVRRSRPSDRALHSPGGPPRRVDRASSWPPTSCLSPRCATA